MAMPARSGSRLAFLIALSLGVVIVLFACLLIFHVHSGNEQGPAVPSDKHHMLMRPDVPTRRRSPVGRTIAVQFSNDTHTFPPSSLPAFAEDKSEYVFNALLERSPKNVMDMHLTVFMLSHSYLRIPDLDLRRVRASYRDVWQQAAISFASTKYYPSGRRRYTYENRFTCHISHSNRSASYVVSGEFVPNRASSSIIANRRLDILRCPMLIARREDVEGHVAQNDIVSVSIFRGETPIIRFNVPWSSRAAGYMAESPPNATAMDPWQGLSLPLATAQSMASTSNVTAATLPSAAPKSLAKKQLHLCVPSMRKPLTADNLPLLLEFIVHHLNIGFDHITLSTVWHWSSPHSRQLLKLLASFIAEGKVSVTTSSLEPLSEDEESPAYELHGLAFFRVFMATIQSNLCLYLSKGVADYSLALDIDEFLVPTVDLGKESLRYLLARNTLQLADDDSLFIAYHQKLRTGKWHPEAGWADQHQHPPCFLSVPTQVVLPKKGLRPGSTPVRGWMGEDYGHGPELSSTAKTVVLMSSVTHAFLPVESIFYSAIRAAGACSLPWNWNGCQNRRVEICLHADGDLEPKPSSNGLVVEHMFDERVTEADGRALSAERDAVVYHFRYYSALSANKSSLASKNLYSQLWFEQTRAEMERRGLDLFLSLPRVDQYLPLPPPPKDSIPLFSANATNRHQFVVTDEIGPEEDMEHARIVEEALVTSDHDVVKLPRFTADYSEFVLTSMIERAAEAWDLSITTFLLCHHVVIPQENHNQHVVLRVHPKAVPAWQNAITQFEQTNYSAIGLRAGNRDAFQCRIRNMVSDTHIPGVHEEMEYVVDGVFVPSRASIDFNANLRVDILRCPMGNSMFNYLQYAGKDEISVEVELLKNGHPLIKFLIPWKGRITGYMAFSPQPLRDWQYLKDLLEEEGEGEGGGGKSAADTATKTYSASSSTAIAGAYAHNFESVRSEVMDEVLYAMPSLSIDPWKGFHREHLGSWRMDKVYLCVPGWRSTPTIQLLAHLYEFIQHHLMMRVDHIVLGVTFSWRSPIMKKLLRLLKPFIEEGKLSIASQSPDDVDFRFSLGGMSARHTPMKVIAANICMYFAKGMADYVAIWDIDEFFIPLGENRNIVDLLARIDTVEDLPYPYESNAQGKQVETDWSPRQRGMASGQGHPLCYIQLYSDSFYRASSLKYTDPNNLWFHDNYQRTDSKKLAHKKGIHPTRKSFYVTLHTGGACRQSPQWTDCREESADLCFRGRLPTKQEFFLTHNFDDKVTALDVYHCNQSLDAVIYHVQFFRWHMAVKGEVVVSEENRYARLYSDAVLNALDARGVYLPLQLLHQSAFYGGEEASFDKDDEEKEDAAAPSSLPPLSPPTTPAALSSASASIPELPLLSSDHAVLFVSAVLAEGLSAPTAGTSEKSLLTFISLDPWRGFLFPDPELAPSEGLQHQVRNALSSWLSSFQSGNISKSNAPSSQHCAPRISAVVCEVKTERTSKEGGAAAEVQSVEGSYIALTPTLGFLSCPLAAAIGEQGSMTASISFQLAPQPPLSSSLLQRLPDQGKSSQWQQHKVQLHIPADSIGTGLLFPPAGGLTLDRWAEAKEFEEDLEIHNSSLLLLTRQPRLQRRRQSGQATQDGEASKVIGGTHLCVPGGWTRSVNRVNLPMLLEFIEHHISLGVQHIYLPVSWAWNAKKTLVLAAILRSYLLDQRVTLLPSFGRLHVQASPAATTHATHLQGESRRSYITSLCAVLAANAGADQLAVWDVHQFFIPARASTEASAAAEENPFRSLVFPEAQPGLPLAIAQVAATDFGENFLSHQMAKQRRRWLGDIYHRIPTLLMVSSGELAAGGVVWPLGRAARPFLEECTAEGSHGKQVQHWLQNPLLPWLRLAWTDPPTSIEIAANASVGSESNAAASQAVLYDFFNMQNSHFQCGDSLSAEMTLEMEQWATVERRRFLHQLHQLCNWYDTGERMVMLHLAPENAADGSGAIPTHLSSNLYHEAYFRRVFQGLIRRNLDLFVDGLEKSGIENDHGYKSGDESYIDYFTVYKTNKLSKKNLTNFTVV